MAIIKGLCRQDDTLKYGQHTLHRILFMESDWKAPNFHLISIEFESKSEYYNQDIIP